MTRGRITSISRSKGIWDPEQGLISQNTAILVAGRHIGRDTEEFKRCRLGWWDGTRSWSWGDQVSDEKQAE
jgi:hypothetical protein